MNLTPKMREAIDLMKAGHILWKDAWTKKGVRGIIRTEKDGRVIPNKDEALSRWDTNCLMVHSSVMKALTERGLIIEKTHQHIHTDRRGQAQNQTFTYYELTQS